VGGELGAGMGAAVRAAVAMGNVVPVWRLIPTRCRAPGCGATATSGGPPTSRQSPASPTAKSSTTPAGLRNARREHYLNGAKLRAAREEIVRVAAEWQALGIDTSPLVALLLAIQEAVAELQSARPRH
jgi:hypothetical protein